MIEESTVQKRAGDELVGRVVSNQPCAKTGRGREYGNLAITTFELHIQGRMCRRVVRRHRRAPQVVSHPERAARPAEHFWDGRWSYLGLQQHTMPTAAASAAKAETPRRRKKASSLLQRLVPPPSTPRPPRDAESAAIMQLIEAHPRRGPAFPAKPTVPSPLLYLIDRSHGARRQWEQATVTSHQTRIMQETHVPSNASAVAYLPCAADGCPFAVTFRGGMRYCCFGCERKYLEDGSVPRTGLDHHSRACLHCTVPRAAQGRNAEWAKLKLCSVGGCGRAIPWHATVCCRLCGPHHGHEHDATCDSVYIVPSSVATNRRKAASVERNLTSACRGIYENAMADLRQLVEHRRLTSAHRRIDPSPLVLKTVSRVAREACATLYEQAQRLTQRRLKVKQQREQQLSTMAQKAVVERALERASRKTSSRKRGGSHTRTLDVAPNVHI